MKIKLNILFLIILSCLIFADGDDCPNCYNPIADAGDSSVYHFGNCNGSFTEICLDGSASSDYEEAMLTYHWTLHNVDNASGELSMNQSLRPDIVFNDIQNASPCFYVDSVSEEEYYTFRLIVNDGEYSSAPDFVTITITDINTPPFFAVNPESNYSLKLGESFVLDLSSLSDSTLNGLTDNGYNILDIDLSLEDLDDGFTYEEHGDYIYTLTSISLDSPDEGYTFIISDGCQQIEYTFFTEIILVFPEGQNLLNILIGLE